MVPCEETGHPATVPEPLTEERDEVGPILVARPCFRAVAESCSVGDGAVEEIVVLPGAGGRRVEPYLEEQVPPNERQPRPATRGPEGAAGGAVSTPAPGDGPLRVMVVGAGRRFLSGPSYYTHALANAMADRWRISLITMRQLLPTRLYPGHARVGAPLSAIEYDDRVAVHDGVDWHWFPSIFRALRLLWGERPDLVLFEWWTGSVLHSYLLLALVARLLGARVVVEFHEILDTGEARLGPIRRYVEVVAPWFMRLAHAFVVHSSHDVPVLRATYRLSNRPIEVIPMGPLTDVERTPADAPTDDDAARPLEILFFGLIRPYKGVEDLIEAFDAIPLSLISGFHLTVVGETWEGWTMPAERIERSRYRERITFVNRYISDAEVDEAFGHADSVCLPYRRSSGSGALMMAMGHGLPVVVTDIPALRETVEKYEGAIVVPVADVDRLRDALLRLPDLRGRRFPDPHSWEVSLDAFARVWEATGVRRARAASAPARLP